MIANYLSSIDIYGRQLEEKAVFARDISIFNIHLPKLIGPVNADFLG
jgi:hypothetical protein